MRSWLLVLAGLWGAAACSDVSGSDPADGWPDAPLDVVDVDVAVDADVPTTDVAVRELPLEDTGDAPDVDAESEGWEPSEIAVPGACVALEPEALADGSLLDRAHDCARFCETVGCVRDCARASRVAASCEECLVRASECLFLECRGCGSEGEEDCAECFDGACGDDWDACAGVFLPTAPPDPPEPMGCEESDYEALANGRALDAFEACRAACPATSGRHECVAGCVARESEITAPCGVCFADWGRCLDGSECAECVRSPTDAECLRCSPEECRESFESCTSGRLSLVLEPPEPASVRLVNVTERSGMALVDVWDGAPYARRVASFGASARSVVEPGIVELATTWGTVGLGADIIAQTIVPLGAAQTWVLIGTEDRLLALEEFPREPGRRWVRVLNATELEVAVSVDGSPSEALSSMEATDRVAMALGDFAVSVSGAPEDHPALATVRTLGPAYDALLVVHSSPDAPTGWSILLLETNGEFFSVELAPADD